MLRDSIYVGMIESPEYGASTRGDFEPLVSAQTFYGAQAILDRRVQVAGPQERNHPDFPLRGFVRCETCGRPLTGSWSKGRNGYYAYYHCQRQCRASSARRPSTHSSINTSSASRSSSRAGGSFPSSEMGCRSPPRFSRCRRRA